jgi:hypothetical protein
VSQSEEDILTALIALHVRGFYTDRLGARARADITESSCREAAKRILGVGFSMASRPVDDRQDEDIDALEIQIEQLRGWSGLPPELRR